MLNTFYALLGRMKYIDRWCLMRASRPENLCEHTLETAYIAHALALLNRQRGGSLEPEKAVLYALYHDCTEILTGDMPTPIKYYNPAIREAYRQVEQVAVDKLLGMLPNELRPTYSAALSPAASEIQQLVKAADKLSAYIKCLEELKAGNTEFRQAAEQTRYALEDMELPEVDYFMEHFLPSFKLTLDELE